MYTIYAVTVIALFCISDVQGVECDIEMMCYGFEADESTGHLIINDVTVATWSSDASVRRKKRQTTHGDGWHVFSMSSSCTPTASLHISEPTSTGNEYLTDFSDFVRDQPQGSYLVGCSAGGTDPAEGNTQLQTATLNAFRALGIDTNATNSLQNFDVGSLLSAEAALIFVLQKGFPQNAIWNIIDTTGATPASLTNDDNVLRTTISIDWYCGIPHMAGAELYEEFDDSGSQYNARDSYFVVNTPVVGSTCSLTGWEYIPNAGNVGGPVMKFGFVSRADDGSVTLIGEQAVVSVESSDHRQFVCASTSYPINDGYIYGVWYDNPGDGESVIRKVYDKPSGIYPHPCGRTANSLDVDVIATSTSDSFSNTPTETVYQSLGVRPIFDPHFVLSCTCATNDDCNGNDENMVCRDDLKCACKDTYAYNRLRNLCIIDADLTTRVSQATLQVSSLEIGDASEVIDENKIGNFLDGTCIRTKPGSKPFVVLDMGLVADVHAVQITTPNPQSGYIEFVDSESVPYRVARNVPDLSMADIQSINLIGELTWLVYSGTQYEGQSQVLTGPATFAAADIPFTVASLRLLDELGTLTASGLCLDVDGNNIIMAATCERNFYIEGNRIVDLVTHKEIIKSGSQQLMLASTTSEAGVEFDTENEGTGQTGITFEDLLGVSDMSNLYELGDRSSCVGVDGANNAIFTTTPSACLSFSITLASAVLEQAWEASEFRIDESFCSNDVDTFSISYPEVRPCVTIIDFVSSNSDSSPQIADLTADKVEFIDQDDSFSSWCRNYQSTVFYQAAETGAHDFAVGVSISNPVNDQNELNEEVLNTCATYVGTVKNEKRLMINCSKVEAGRFVTLYTPHDQNPVDQMLLCDMQVFGLIAMPCNDQNGGCDHNCVPGQVEGERLCTCFDEQYTLQDDGTTCLDINECDDDALHVCDEDQFATCVNEEPGYNCTCADSLDDVVVFNYDTERCHVPQESRDSGILDNLCSYQNGGCEDTCNAGSSVYDYTCACLQTDADYVLAADGRSCMLLDACVVGNECEQDPTGLATCEDQALGHTCTCLHADLGVTWDDVNNRCTTGGDPDTFCEFEGTCHDTAMCVPESVDSGETIESPLHNYTCVCETGFQMIADGSCEDVQECTDTPSICNAGVVDGTCNNAIGSFTCTCPNGYTFEELASGCVDENECETNNGGCPQTCTNIDGGRTCFCWDGYEGNGEICTDVNECLQDALNECSQTCLNNQGGYDCACTDGFVRDDDTIGGCVDIPECDGAHQCQHTCNERDGGFECSCDDGYELSGLFNCVDRDECELGIDFCDVECRNTPGSFDCLCPDGYELAADDRNCLDKNECADGTHQCSDNCNNEMGSYTCSCDEGGMLLADELTCFTGTDPCDEVNCAHRCVPNLATDGTAVAQCQCDPGYTVDGTNCNNINECATGEALCDQDCTDTDGSFLCSCRSGFTLAADDTSCENIDECALNTDRCQQVCVDNPGSFTCMCRENFEVNPNNPFRCRPIAINMIMVIPVIFGDFVGTQAAVAQLSICDQIRVLMVIFFGPGRLFIIANCVIYPGSVAVNFTIEYNETVSDSESAQTSVMMQQALENEPITSPADPTVTATPTQFFVDAVDEMTGEVVQVELNGDACGIWNTISYCANGSSCNTTEDSMPYCVCAEGYTGDRCDIVVVVLEEEDEDDERDGLTGTDVILLAVFATLLVVLLAVTAFYAVYRSQRPDYSRYYDRSKPPTSSRTSDRLYTTRWWQNLPMEGATASPYHQTRPRPRPTARPAPRPAPQQWNQYIMGNEALSRWPAYRAYGIASRFTGGAPSSRYSWNTRGTNRY